MFRHFNWMLESITMSLTMMISLTVLCRKYEIIVHTDSEEHLLIYSEILVQKRLWKPLISSVFSHHPIKWLLKAYLISVYMKFEIDQIIPVNDREPPIVSIIITYDYQRAEIGPTCRTYIPFQNTKPKSCWIISTKFQPITWEIFYTTGHDYDCE